MTRTASSSCQMLDDIVAHDIAQGIGIPIPATKDRLLPPWTGSPAASARHPTGLCVAHRRADLPENRPAFLATRSCPNNGRIRILNLSKRRSPQRKRLFNRRCLRPRSSNHGYPWIQKSSERATVMLARPRAGPAVLKNKRSRRPKAAVSGSVQNCSRARKRESRERVGANAGAFLPERGFIHSSGNVCFATAFQLMRRNLHETERIVYRSSRAADADRRAGGAGHRHHHGQPKGRAR